MRLVPPPPPPTALSPGFHHHIFFPAVPRHLQAALSLDNTVNIRHTLTIL